MGKKYRVDSIINARDELFRIAECHDAKIGLKATKAICAIDELLKELKEHGEKEN